MGKHLRGLGQDEDQYAVIFFDEFFNEVTFVAVFIGYPNISNLLVLFDELKNDPAYGDEDGFLTNISLRIVAESQTSTEYWQKFVVDAVERQEQEKLVIKEIEDGRFKNYTKKSIQPMRPYVPGEDMTGISVSPEDTPELGGMIAINPLNKNDKWYVAKDFFNLNYQEHVPTGV